jgi:hypothetical protein
MEQMRRAYCRWSANAELVSRLPRHMSWTSASGRVPHVMLVALAPRFLIVSLPESGRRVAQPSESQSISRVPRASFAWAGFSSDE